MPQVYTVATKNAFAALDDNSDGELIHSQPPPAKEQPEQQPAQEQQQSTTDNRQRRQPGRPNNGPRPPTGNRQPRPAGVADFSEADATRPARRKQVPREPKINPVETRLDRHSGTGRGKEMKKDGGGAHNWGNQEQDFGGEDDVAKRVESGSDKEVDGEQRTAQATPAQPEPPASMLYADYAQKRAEEAAFQPKEVSKAVPKVESGYQVYTKDVKNTNSGAKDQHGQHEKERKKQTMPVPLRYQANRQMGGPGGRDNGQRRRNPNQESPVAEKQQKASGEEGKQQLDLQDQSAFPTLEAH